jgi:hypothetical protein
VTTSNVRVCFLLPLQSHRTSSNELCSTVSQLFWSRLPSWKGRLRLLELSGIGLCIHLMGAAFDAGAAARGFRAVSIGEVDLQQPLPVIERYGIEGPMLGSLRSMSADATTGMVASAGSYAQRLMPTRRCRFVDRIMFGRCTWARQNMVCLRREADLWLCCVPQALVAGLPGERRGGPQDYQVAWAARPATIPPPCSAATPWSRCATTTTPFTLHRAATRRIKLLPAMCQPGRCLPQTASAGPASVH